MVRNYIRKTNRGSWNENSMELAIQAVETKEMSLRKAAASYCVPKDSLSRRVNKNLKSVSDGDNLNKSILGPYRKVLSNKQEKELAEYIVKMDNAFYGLSIQELQKVVFDYVEKNKIPHPFNVTTKLAGRDFVSAFLKRQRILSVRKPEGVSVNRVFGLNRKAVNRYFDNLEKLINEHGFEPNRLFNCDESGLTAVHKPSKVITTKGKKVVSSVTSAERGQTTTILLAMNPTGQYIPPLMIYKRKRMKDTLIDHAPAGTLGCCSDSGWIEKEIFMNYIKHFIKHTNCTPENKCLLILDGHKSHTKNLDLLQYASERGLYLLSLPPHTSHKLQPLDRGVFKALKNAYNVACSDWLRKHPARRISINEIAELFSCAYVKAATIDNAMSGFRASGIYPLNRNILSEGEYLHDPRDDIPETELNPPNPVQSVESISVASVPELPAVQVDFNMDSTINVPDKPGESTLDGSVNQVNSESFSFHQILPVPEIKYKESKRKGEQSEILTSSPYKRALAEAQMQSGRKSKNSSLLKTAKKLKDQSAKSAKRSKAAKANPIKKVTLKGKSKNIKKCGTSIIRKPSEDWECKVCGDFWSNSRPGEDWTLCSSCGIWCHEDCCSVLSASSFVCDVCLP